MYDIVCHCRYHLYVVVCCFEMARLGVVQRIEGQVHYHNHHRHTRCAAARQLGRDFEGARSDTLRSKILRREPAGEMDGGCDAEVVGHGHTVGVKEVDEAPLRDVDDAAGRHKDMVESRPIP